MLQRHGLLHAVLVIPDRAQRVLVGTIVGHVITVVDRISFIGGSDLFFQAEDVNCLSPNGIQTVIIQFADAVIVSRRRFILPV